ncbi:MAG: hypothetical protein AAF363_22055 [Bacteroidota bacterium]
MSRQIEEGQTALSIVSNIVDQILSGFDSNQEVYILDNSGLLSRPQEFKNVTDNTFKNTNKSLNGLLDIINKKQKQDFDDRSNTVFVVSDFQKSFTGNLSDLDFNENLTYNLVDFSSAIQSNIYVDTLYFGEENADELTELIVSIWNSGDSPRDTYVTLLRDDVVYASSSLIIPSGGNELMTFDISQDFSEFIGEIKIEDNSITFDNSFFFISGKKPKATVTYLSNAAGSNKTIFDKVFSNNTKFNYQVESIDNYNMNNLKSVDFLIISASKDDNQNVNKFVEAASLCPTRVLIIPSEFDSKIFEGFSGKKNNLLSEQSEIQIAELGHPIFKNVFSEDFKIANAELPTSIRPLIIPEQARIILSNDYGEPILSEINNSNTYLLGVPLGTKYTNISRHAIFLPMLYNLSESTSEYKRPYFRLNQNEITIKPDTLLDRSEILKLENEGNQFIPNQWFGSDGINLEIYGTDLVPGHYNLTSSNFKVASLAFNNRKEESDIDEYSYQELNDYFKDDNNVQVFNYTDFYNSGISEAGISSSNNYWRYFLIVALLFLFTEVILIRFL